jgi:hypothetical protein
VSHGISSGSSFHAAPVSNSTAFYDLDVRASARFGNVFHIECSSARNLVSSSVKAGVLHKLGSGGGIKGLISSGPPPWGERFVVFRVVPMLLYYPKDTDSEPQRVIVLNDSSTVEYLGAYLGCSTMRFGERAAHSGRYPRCRAHGVAVAVCCVMNLWIRRAHGQEECHRYSAAP